jgi:hypothetical protein
MSPMNRREALKTGGVALGGLFVLSSGVLVGCEREADKLPKPTGMLTSDQQDLVEEIADTLLPKTASSPGAKEAHAGAEINLLLSDCYEPPAQQRIVDGLKNLELRSHMRFHQPFAKLQRKDREEMLRALSAEGKAAPPDSHWFPLMRELSLRAYFSSEVGMTKALRYVMVPGKFNGCIPLTPGQAAWA